MIGSRDILIQGGLVYDGSLNSPRISDILISGDRIIFVGGSFRKDCLVIDARGLSVAPGFIDSHSHSDFTLLADPRAEGKISQGITTEINGNCGLSAAPLKGAAAERREGDLRELDITERWQTYAEYFTLLKRKGMAVNSAYLAGHGSIRGSVLGYDDRQPSSDEMVLMRLLLQQAIEEGAIGLSTGLIYPPGVYSSFEELASLASLVREHDLIYTSHMRSEGAHLLEAIQEILRIGTESGARVHISHVKTAGQENWVKAEEVVLLIGKALESGLRVTCDRYPYTASSTDLDAILPSWTYAGGNDAELERLGSSEARRIIRQDMQRDLDSEGYWDRIIVSSVGSEKNRWMEGRTLADISRALGTEGLDVVFRILLEERLRVGAIFHSMSEENLKKFLCLPVCMIGSDSSARGFDGITVQGRPHPRTFGTFPRFLGSYVLQKKIMTLAEAVHKSSMLPAMTFQLEDRGEIREGMFADVVIFDESRLLDKATYENPFRKPEGIAYVLVNGIPALWDGELTGKRGGRILKSSTRSDSLH